MTFDQTIHRAGTHCSKWDMMQPLYGLSPQDGLAMWVADMEFRPPAVVQQALQRMLDHGVYVIAFSYPVVPQGKARIRTQMSAAHSPDDCSRCPKPPCVVK